VTSASGWAVRDRILREGPLRFDVAMDLLLYGAGGFFATGGGAGRRADFLTGPELGPLLGAVLARAIDDEWRRLGRPDPFVVVEAGAGRGALAAAVLAAGPDCAPALRYLCVERSPVLRERLAEGLPVEPPADVLGPVLHGDDDDGTVTPGVGPVVTVLDDLPRVTVVGMVVANELLDNLPTRLLERTATGWDEVFVGLDGELLVAAPPEVAEEAGRLAPAAAPGRRIPLQHDAVAWLRRAGATLEEGRVLLVDYADTTASMASRPWTEWLRTYRAHAPGSHPVDDPGDQDVTCEVAVDQLARWRPPDLDRSQADWLRANGLDELVEAARATWWARAHLGDLVALAARSRVGEADALTDPAGFGAFRVLEWVVGPARSRAVDARGPDRSTL
jgi:SAM-dependent MidA family methyltransferase